MKNSRSLFRVIIITCFLFFSLNRILAGYLHLSGIKTFNLNTPLFSPLGPSANFGISPLPRAYTGLGFSDPIKIYVVTSTGDHLINLDFHAIDQQASGHLYKYDVLLHSLFWPIKAPDIEAYSKKILTHTICEDPIFLRANSIEESPLQATVLRSNILSGEVVWTSEILCKN